MASPLSKSLPSVTKVTFMVTNKRITQMEKEMKEWKAETEEWWKEKATILQMIFNEGKRWKEDLHIEIKALKVDSTISHMEIKVLKKEVLALKREFAETRTSGGLEKEKFSPQ